MADWKPEDAPIQQGEWLGRRIFDKSAIVYTEKNMIDPNIFVDDRIDDDLSFDRLGGNPHPSTVKRLCVLSDAQAKLRKKVFNGWAAVQPKSCAKFAWRPDPIKDLDGDVDNPNHAVIKRSHITSKEEGFHYSRSLFLQFLMFGNIFNRIR